MEKENKLIELLKIKYPVVQGGMAGISDSTLVSAVSNAGGLGTLGSGLMPGQWLKDQIKKTRELTKNPFAVNLYLQNPKAPDLVRVIIEEKVPVVFTGGGNPLPLFSYFKAAGIKIIPVVPSPRLAKKMEENGADAVVVEGMEAGGHIGDNTTFCLIPQTKALLTKIPLIAAGGIYDGKSAAAAILLGADGVQMGTRFLASKECPIDEKYKKRIIDATSDDLTVALRFAGHPLRMIKNQLSEEWKKMEERGAFPEEVKAEKIVSSKIVAADIEKIPLLAGICAGAISEIKTCKEIVEEIGETINKLICNI